jgi:SAM-dependent methyltransferase
MSEVKKIEGEIHDKVRRYFDEKISSFGPNHLGVGWNSGASQELRFVQLSRIFAEHEGSFSLNDFGCGYGLYLDYLITQQYEVDYLGFDISELMIQAAMDLHSGIKSHQFLVAERSPRVADYTVASGIFNVKMDISSVEWKQYVLSTLDLMSASCSRGFAFNILTSYSDADRLKNDLYYAIPEELFAECKKKYSKNVALLHDYDLYEFTILVRKRI